jgi:hypothetical protein
VSCDTGGAAAEGNSGASQVTLPFKGPVAKLDREEEMMVIEIEFWNILEDAESLWGIREDVGSDDWYTATMG